ncbi:hypothetical protein TeGR_g13472 [Tetraparma gracilis]|uniref:Uncharacterized protein n=1 Tax=Tetraparma gracilis TaxID=2962635 RepID=A0ABQ6N086_9STRA|nr:hypothetical protein TeGR_g13472 [Tetraparma gracilis]
MMPTQMPHPTRFSYADLIPNSLSLSPVANAGIVLPPGVRPEARGELLALVGGKLSGRRSFSKGEQGLNADGDFGEVCDATVRITDYTMAGYQFALSMNWAALTQCDMGSLSILARTVKKSKPVVVLETGCGENGSGGSEATDKQMKAMMKKMGLQEATAAELIGVLLSVAGPDFLATFADSEPYDVERWEGVGTPLLKAAGELLGGGGEGEGGGEGGGEELDEEEEENIKLAGGGEELDEEEEENIKPAAAKKRKQDEAGV